jgi:hypothetical protein
MAKDELSKYIDEMKSGEVEPAEFYKNLMSVLASLDVSNEDLKGVTPLLLNFVNSLLKNMDK